MAETLNAQLLKTLRKKHYAECREYVEDYYETAIDAFPEYVPFSSDARDLHNMGMDLWLACGDVALDSGDETLQQEFLQAAKKAGILNRKKQISA